MTGSIVRVFHCTTRSGSEQDYGDYLAGTAAPALLTFDGLQALEVASSDNQREYVVLSVWDDLTSLSAFTGANADATPRLWSEEERMLEHATVRHFRQLARFERLSAVDVSEPSSFPRPASRVQVDSTGKRAWVDGRLIHLPPQEFRVLESLVAAPGSVLNPSELSQALWPGSNRAQTKDVRRAIYRLRRLLGPALGHTLIRTRPGFGYFLDA